MNFLRKPFKYTYKNAVSIIIGINIAVFILKMVFIELNFYLGLIPAFIISRGMYWQVFTYQFMHGDVFHLLFNMLVLLFFGIPAERTIGSKEFVLYYLFVGTLSGILSFAVYTAFGAYTINLIGASGALFGVLLLYAIIFPKSIIYIWGILPVPAPLLIIGYAVMELLSIFSLTDGIAHLTHFMGLIAGWLYIVVRLGIHPFKVWNSGRY